MQVPFRQYSDVSGNGFYKRKKLSSFPGHRRTDVNRRNKQVNKLRSVSLDIIKLNIALMRCALSSRCFLEWWCVRVSAPIILLGWLVHKKCSLWGSGGTLYGL